jgi:N-acetylglucosaminyl-diphospho-decaprenol L-rhamnosyltransferase
MSRPLTVAVVTHNSLADLRRFFRGQLETAAALGATAVVVDNASTDGSVPFVRAGAGEAAVVVANPRNRGYAAAVNRAFAVEAQSDVLVLNPDVELAAAAPVEAMVRLMRGNPRIGAVGPCLVNEDGTIQSSARRFPSPLAMGRDARTIRRLRAARRAARAYVSPPAEGAPSRVDWVTGAAMLIRREAFEEVGGWDEGFYMYLEDTDFCRRLARAGWATWYLPAARLRHLHARQSDRGAGGLFRSRARRVHLRSMARFFARYPELISGRHLASSSG